MSGTTLQFAYWPAPHGAQFVEISNGSNYHVTHPDWLGSARVISNQAHSVTGDLQYSPYGEITAQPTVPGNNSLFEFAGLTQNFYKGALMDSDNREYSITPGRWLSPDPVATGWNQYAYPTNPNSFTDPSGLDPCTNPNYYGCDASQPGPPPTPNSDCTGWCPGQFGGEAWNEPLGGDLSSIEGAYDAANSAATYNNTMNGLQTNSLFGGQDCLACWGLGSPLSLPFPGCQTDFGAPCSPVNQGFVYAGGTPNPAVVHWLNSSWYNLLNRYWDPGPPRLARPPCGVVTCLSRDDKLYVTADHSVDWITAWKGCNMATQLAMGFGGTGEMHPVAEPTLLTGSGNYTRYTAYYDAAGQNQGTAAGNAAAYLGSVGDCMGQVGKIN